METTGLRPTEDGVWKIAYGDPSKYGITREEMDWLRYDPDKNLSRGFYFYNLGRKLIDLVIYTSSNDVILDYLEENYLIDASKNQPKEIEWI